jgi:hypothetical protein
MAFDAEFGANVPRLVASRIRGPDSIQNAETEKLSGSEPQVAFATARFEVRGERLRWCRYWAGW